MNSNPTPATIEIQIETIEQLFHSLDPFPFHKKDLDRDAEEFIVSWARELPARQPIKILIHLPPAEAGKPESADIPRAVASYFASRSEASGRDLKDLFRIGRRALSVGLTVLIGCVLLSQAAATSLPPRPFGWLIEESLIILGWVANWKPIEIFLYDWWPMVRQRNLYDRLRVAEIEVRPTAARG
jgi:hypothetical protein